MTLLLIAAIGWPGWMDVVDVPRWTWFDAAPTPAVKASAAALKPVVTIYSMPNCPACVRLKELLGDGDAAFAVKHVLETDRYSYGAYPVLTAVGRAPMTGCPWKTKEQAAAAVRAWLGVTR